VAAPGGSHNVASRITAVETNACDGATSTFADRNANDYTNLPGTSMSAPHVGGLAALVIQAMEDNGFTWTWSETDALKVKSIILMTAGETNNAVHPGESTNDPPLNRGTNDLVEGYGRINADAAIEAATMSYTIGTTAQDTLGANPTDKRVWARQVSLTGGQEYTFSLTVPAGADFDLYLYDGTDPAAGTAGTPVILEQSTAAATGGTETITCTPASTTDAYIVVKWVSGSGQFSLDSAGGAEVPTVTTSAATAITENSATLNGNLNSIGSASPVSVSFEWGLTAAYGNETAPQAMGSPGAFEFDLVGLLPDTTYYFRAKVTGSVTVYGGELSFTTLTSSLNPDFEAYPRSGDAPLEVTFDPTWTAGGVAPYVKAEWDFDGDGVIDLTIADPTGVDTMLPVTYTYLYAGTYTVSLTITDSSEPPLVYTETKIGYITVEGEVVDILDYYRAYSGNPNVVDTQDLLKAANDWAHDVVPPGFTEPISTTQLLALANEWAATE